jgi:hypothetical protein
MIADENFQSSSLGEQAELELDHPDSNNAHQCNDPTIINLSNYMIARSKR